MAEAPIFGPPESKNWLIGKDPDAGKDWRQEEKGTTEDEVVGWHCGFNGHEFEKSPGDSEGERKSGGLQFMGLQRVGHNWVTKEQEAERTFPQPGGGWSQEQTQSTLFFKFRFLSCALSCSWDHQGLRTKIGSGGNFTDLPLQRAEHSPCVVSLNPQKSRGLTVSIPFHHQVVEAVRSCVWSHCTGACKARIESELDLTPVLTPFPSAQ